MTTTAWATPGLDANPASDVMEIHSDGQLNVGNVDVDVDIDFEFPQSPVAYGDDLSLKDAALNEEVDTHTASADQDGFMVDKEDLIEEDTVTYDDDAVIMDQPSADHADPVQQHRSPIEDDLIDYSDDEEEPVPTESSPVKTGDIVPENVEAAELGAVAPAADDSFAAIDFTTVDPVDENEEAKEVDVGPSEDVGQIWQEEVSHEDEARAASHQHSPDAQQHEESYNELDISAVAEQPEKNIHADEDHQVQKQKDSEDVNFIPHDSNEGSSPSGQDIELHPVTVNYSGAELWLFKHHDYENSGDYLVEDTSITNEPISAVLEACRAALGSDITDDIELGFRLDNFHSMELYQDHSSCAFITLEHLVGLYLQLHMQDGNPDPESFYMTLLSRPRVSALLNALNEAASEGIGHVGLNKAIAAGLTSFNAHLSHNSTDDAWDNEEQQQGLGLDVANDHHDVERHGEEEYEAHEEPAEEQYEGQTQLQEHGSQESRAPEQSEEVNNSTALAQESATVSEALLGPDNTTLNVTDAVDGGAASNATPHETNDHVLHSDASRPQSQQEEDDFVDYSDDEGDAETADVHPARLPSSASSTVQGDAAFPVHEDGQDATNHALTEHDDKSLHQYPDGVVEESDAQYNGLDEAFDAQAYEEGYDEQYEDANDQEHTELYDDEGNFESQYHEQDHTNDYNAEYEEHAAEPYDEVTAGVDGVNYDAQVLVDGDDSIGEDAFQKFGHENEIADTTLLDTADTTLYENADDKAQIDEYYHNDEDGEDVQALVAAASVDVDPVVTSSAELFSLSPQGQKRTIDEVGNDVGEAADPSGMIHTCKYGRSCTYTNNEFPDAKRPRV